MSSFISIKLAELQELKSGIIVDVRATSDAKESGVPDASKLNLNTINIPLKINGQIDEFFTAKLTHSIAEKGQKLIFMCYRGFSSQIAASMAADAGYSYCHSLEGGFGAWNAENLPIKKIQ